MPGNLEEDVVERLIVYHRNIDGINEAYKKVMKVINADQPKADVFSEGQWTQVEAVKCKTPMLSCHCILVTIL